MNVHRIAEQRQNVASGFTFAAAVVVVGLLFAVSEGSINGARTPAVHDATPSAAAAPPASTEYFPAGYTLNPEEPAPHVEAF